MEKLVTRTNKRKAVAIEKLAKQIEKGVGSLTSRKNKMRLTPPTTTPVPLETVKNNISARKHCSQPNPILLRISVLVALKMNICDLKKKKVVKEGDISINQTIAATSTKDKGAHGTTTSRKDKGAHGSRISGKDK